jgi:hypothetical protein
VKVCTCYWTMLRDRLLINTIYWTGTVTTYTVSIIYTTTRPPPPTHPPAVSSDGEVLFSSLSSSFCLYFPFIKSVRILITSDRGNTGCQSFGGANCTHFQGMTVYFCSPCKETEAVNYSWRLTPEGKKKIPPHGLNETSGSCSRNNGYFM